MALGAVECNIGETDYLIVYSHNADSHIFSFKFHHGTFCLAFSTISRKRGKFYHFGAIDDYLVIISHVTY